MRSVYNRGAPAPVPASRSEHEPDDIHKHIDALEKAVRDCQLLIKEIGASIGIATRVSFTSSSGKHEPTELLLERAKKLLNSIIKRSGELIGFNNKRVTDNTSRTIATNRLKKIVAVVESLPPQLRRFQRDYDSHLKSTEHVPLDKLFAPSASASTASMASQKHEQLLTSEIEMSTLDANERYDEIVKIAKSATELSQMFTELSVIVTGQGEILDRIDANMDSAVSHTVAGKDNVVAADKYQKKGGCCVYLIIALLVLIAIMIIIIIVKSS